MADLAARAEVRKLSLELGMEVEQLAFLREADAAAVQQLRTTIADARFDQLQPQLKRLASTVNLLPLALTARIAKSTIGPSLSGKIANVLDPAAGIKFAQHYDAAYLAKVSVTLRPDSSAAIIGAARPELAIAVATELMRGGEYVTLGRMVCAAPANVVAGVIPKASAIQLLLLAYYSDDHDRLDEIMDGSSDDTLLAVVRAAVPDHLEEALSVITFVKDGTRARLLAAVEKADLLDEFRAEAKRLDVEVRGL